MILRHFGWRWIFLGLVPFVALAALLALPGLLRLKAVPGAERGVAARWQDAVMVAIGVGAFLGGLTSHRPVGVLGVVAGAAIGLPPLRRLLPPGTLTGQPGLPAAILSRGLLTFLFFAVDSYVPLAVRVQRPLEDLAQPLVDAVGVRSRELPVGRSPTEERRPEVLRRQGVHRGP